MNVVLTLKMPSATGVKLEEVVARLRKKHEATKPTQREMSAVTPETLPAFNERAKTYREVAKKLTVSNVIRALLVLGLENITDEYVLEQIASSGAVLGRPRGS